MTLDELNDILNHDSNISFVHAGNDPSGGEGRRVLASRPLAPGDIIGPSKGLPAEAVFDPVEILRRHDVGKAILGVVSDSDKMAFWMSLAAMGRDAKERQRRRQQDTNKVANVENPGKKRKLGIFNNHDNAGDGQSDSGRTAGRIPQKQEIIFDAYLLSLPREGPDPCCWSDCERSKLLSGTPLGKQIEVTLKQAREEYDRAAAGISNSSDPDVRGIELPPFCIGGRGSFPSVLWARSMHQSRSFPRSLVDEEGVWWQGRKKYVPPSESSSSSSLNSVTDSIIVSEEVETGGDDSNCNNMNNGTILSVRLGGFRAPVISVQKDSFTQADEPPPPLSKQHGSTLGIIVPLYDMLDHKPGHAVQWEAATLGNNRHCIRFRCVHPIAKGEPIWNNYGPKGNGELLATYGFAVRNNVLDSVEGIVLGIRTPAPSNDNGNKDDATETDVDGGARVHKVRMELIKEYSIPHRFRNDEGVLLLGPFSLHHKLPSNMGEEEEMKGGKITSKYDAGVVPDDLYRALGIIGMENEEEGPVVSEDELEMLRDVLTKKLDGFGRKMAMSEKDVMAHSPRAEFVEAYKDGQRELLRLALAELDALMPCDGGEEENTLP